ncbi:hypothetical protein HQ45_03620 [Porphyromonas crevioricanis]|uniref:IscR-regulated protein YhgI n=2 Tax=Porphyromonas crevioricanis TaxID=393921 RepID=A0A0A2FSK7_9PORP|nr:NifU family protein [Porphyromonas crevioricanis]KGN89932.1 hypothetical protein HQ45_03620 [Porphyromonas crevioricanis]KGN94116.1 hypothetical protein HQ38_06115 [Porphyromonas crevioricanis]SJZ66004.1 NifU-like domain-containing protein [Porphyromonas crevioricanis]SQH73923.1 IscR-regulated protein YhgI [Porphyromonas crevioricanis]GAD04768.1 NifU-related protein [Porphyromonas crevioricanis JCM 15906]
MTRKLPTESEIKEVLDRDVRPSLMNHSGDVQLKSIRPDGTVVVEFLGSCRFCPAALDTLESLIGGAFANSFPQSNLRVVLGGGVSDSLLSEAKRLMGKTH